MTAKFNGTSGRCSKFARQAVRLGFHDAAVWSKRKKDGGAGGGILLSDEMSRADNNGLSAIADQTKKWYHKYNQYGMSMADIIQFGANVRDHNSKAGPTGLLPEKKDSANKLIKLFQDKTIDAHDLVALVGAHTTSQQRFVDTTRDGDPQDSTPGIWDMAFYPQTTNNAPVRVIKFRSDINLSKDSRTSPSWQQFSDRATAQGRWNADYAKTYTRLSLLGVDNINDLKECTKVLPAERPTFVSEDQVLLDRWLNGEFGQLNNLVDNATKLTGVISSREEKPLVQWWLHSIHP
ncbi:unnamed protein product [Alternaria alternata]